MKRLFLALLLFPALGFCQYNHSVPMIQGYYSESDACDPTGGGYATIVSGDLLIVAMSFTAGTGSVTVNDTRSSSWTQEYLDTSANPSIVIFAAYAGGSGADTITVTQTGASGQYTTCAEFPPNWSLTKDGATLNRFSGTPATVTTPNVTSTLNNDLLYAHGWSGLRVWPTVGFNAVVTDYYYEAAEWKVTGAPGSYSATFNNNGASGIAAVLLLQSNSLAITTPSTLPSAVANSPYSYTLQAAGGVSTYTWSKTGGTLPSGLTLSSSGVISGTPLGSAPGTATVKVTDGTNTATQTVSIHVGTSYLTPTVRTASTQYGGSNAVAVHAGDVVITLSFDNNRGSKQKIWDGEGNLYSTLGTVAMPYAAVGYDASYQFQSDAAVVASTTATLGVNGGINQAVIVIYNVQDFNGDAGITEGPFAGSGTVSTSSVTTLAPGSFFASEALCENINFHIRIQSPFTELAYYTDGGSGYYSSGAIGGYSAPYTLSNADNYGDLLFAFRPATTGTAPVISGGRKAKVTMY